MLSKFACFASLALMATALSAGDALPSAESSLDKAVAAEGNQARLQQFFKKAEGGGKIVVGVLGGSITQGAMASAPEKRYANVALSWLKDSFPKAEFSLVNAGIGATGSDYGALRVQRDLLSKNPDLVVLEYAVNDMSSKACAESYEGTARQILKAPSHPALVLLFMFRKDGTNAQELESKIGAHYQLPMLSCRDALWPEMQEGRLKWTQYSPDSVHPNDAGHAFTGNLLAAFLEKSRKSAKAWQEPPLPEPLVSGAFEQCSLFEGADLKPLKNNGWTFNNAKVHETGWESSTPGSAIEFEVEGESVYSSYWRIHKDMGIASATVDGGAPIKLDAWFEKTWGGYMQTTQIAKGLKPGKHLVRIEILQERNPCSSGNSFRILALGGCEANAQ